MRRDRDVVDVDVLLADQVEQQVERALINIADGDGKGKSLSGFGFCAAGICTTGASAFPASVAGIASRARF